MNEVIIKEANELVSYFKEHASESEAVLHKKGAGIILDYLEEAGSELVIREDEGVILRAPEFETNVTLDDIIDGVCELGYQKLREVYGMIKESKDLIKSCELMSEKEELEANQYILDLMFRDTSYAKACAETAFKLATETIRQYFLEPDKAHVIEEEKLRVYKEGGRVI